MFFGIPGTNQTAKTCHAVKTKLLRFGVLNHLVSGEAHRIGDVVAQDLSDALQVGRVNLLVPAARRFLCQVTWCHTRKNPTTKYGFHPPLLRFQVIQKVKDLLHVVPGHLKKLQGLKPNTADKDTKLPRPKKMFWFGNSFGANESYRRAIL